MEFLELVVIFLNGKLLEGVVFHPPGPVHHAIWMAKGIYCLKISLFRKQFLLDTEDSLKYRDVCIFIVKIYVQSWFRATSAIHAPKQDLEFLKQLYDYKSIDENVSNAGLNKFQGHLWYLTPELAALAFFDVTVSNAEKLKMIKALESDCSTFVYNKKVIANDKNVVKIVKSNLSDFICSKSYNLFKRLKIDSTFLSKHPSTWDEDMSYNFGLKVVKSLKVVDDTTERGVKLITEFNNLLTKDDQQLQYLLPVVTEYRNTFPDFPESNKDTLMMPYK